MPAPVGSIHAKQIGPILESQFLKGWATGVTYVTYDYEKI